MEEIAARLATAKNALTAVGTDAAHRKMTSSLQADAVKSLLVAHIGSMSPVEKADVMEDLGAVGFLDSDAHELFSILV